MYSKSEPNSQKLRPRAAELDKDSALPLSVVHIVDDDAGLRDALTDLLRSMGYQVHGYGSTDEFLASGAPSTIGCLLLDVRLPGLGGLEFQEHLAKSHINMPIVFMTGYADVKMSVQGMKGGAVDFLEKPFRDQDLLDAVAAALQAANVAAIEAAKVQRGIAGERQVLELRYGKLSPRERQVMTLVAAGLMNKQVAGRLSISEVTVKIHRSSVMKKMGAKSLAQLARMAEVMGIEL